MIDILTLALTHGLMAFAAITLIARDDLDDEGGPKPVPRWRRKPADPAQPTASVDAD
jgi:hypothetical protein